MVSRRRALSVRSSLAAAILAASLGTAAKDARASDPCHAGPLLSTCIASDTLWPHAGPQRFVAVGGTETNDAGRIGFGLVTTYLSRPIVLHIPSPGPAGSDQYVIDNQVNGTFLWSYGVTRRLELDLAVPITFGQSGTGAAPITAGASRLQDTALRDLRFGGAYALVPREPASKTRVWALTARFEMSVPIADHDQYAGDRTVVFIPSVAADYRRGRWFAGVELGGRIRPAEQLLGARVGPQAMIGVGVGYDILKRVDLLSAMIEARALPTFSDQTKLAQTPQGAVPQGSAQALVPAEWMLSVRSSPTPSSDLAFTLGGGGAIPTGGEASVTAPRFRFLLGVRYAPSEGDRDRDRDGVPDVRDECPGDAGVGPTGCPPGVASAAATPHLDLASASDACKDDPDTVDGFDDLDGCPDEDSDKDGVENRYDKCPLESEDFAGLTEGCPEAQTPASPQAPTKP